MFFGGLMLTKSFWGTFSFAATVSPTMLMSACPQETPPLSDMVGCWESVDGPGPVIGITFSGNDDSPGVGAIREKVAIFGKGGRAGTHSYNINFRHVPPKFDFEFDETYRCDYSPSTDLATCFGSEGDDFMIQRAPKDPDNPEYCIWHRLDYWE